MAESASEPAATAPDGPEAMLCFNLYAANHAFTRFYKPLLDPLGLTYPQYLVLLALAREDGVGVGRLSEAVRLETNTLSPLLKRLEAVGYVARARDGADERRVRVSLTPRGRAAAEQAARVPEGVARRLGLTEAEIAGALDVLRRLRAALDDDAAPAA